MRPGAGATLVVVDEMAMLDAKVTGELLREAKLAGAKVVWRGRRSPAGLDRARRAVHAN